MNTHVYRGPSAFPTCLPQRGSMRMVLGTFASHSRSPLHLVASLLNGSRSWAPERSHANFAFYACLQQKSRKDTASILPVRSLSHLVPRVRNRSRVEVDPGHDAQIRGRKSEGANQKAQIRRCKSEGTRIHRVRLWCLSRSKVFLGIERIFEPYSSLTNAGFPIQLSRCNDSRPVSGCFVRLRTRMAAAN